MYKVQASVLFLVLIAGIRSADAQTYTVLYNFGMNKTGGTLPAHSLVEDKADNLYGITETGPLGLTPNGTIFKLAPSGTLTSLHSFTSSEGYPVGVTLGTDGNLYGVTDEGGTSANCPGGSYSLGGCGTIFKLTPGGTFSVLYNFDLTHGSDPFYPLTLGSDGNFYGTASDGGSSNCTGGCGVIFSITPQGNYSVLYDFDGTNGSSPGPLVQAKDGTFYGTTEAGGTNNTGTMFSLTTAGQFTVLYNFGPYNYSVRGLALVQGEDGNFYGTTDFGAQPYVGSVFKITPQGSFSVVYDFPLTQGYNPFSLVQSTEDNLFGLAYGGILTCPGGCGVIFQVTSSGAFSLVHKFDGTQGWLEQAGSGLLRGNDGNYYGTTLQGGTATGNGCQGGCGVLYALVVNDFSVTASAFNPGTISPGASSTSAVNVAAVGGFSTSVALACSVQPTSALAPTCSISSNSVTPGTAATLTVRTTAPGMAGLPIHRRSGPFYGFWLALAGLAVAWVDLGLDRRERLKLATLLLPGALLLGLAFTAGCGGSSTTSTGGSGTPSGTYKVTVTGTSGFLQHSTTTTLTVH